MARSSYLAQSAIAVFLMAAPIGDTTVLLLFSVSLECLLALMLVRERQLRLRSGVRKGVGHIVTPFPLLVRTAPHMRAKGLARGHIIGNGNTRRRRSCARERHVSVAGL